jgi:1-deoxyxylulose-5-phosphate synthase
VIEQIRLGNSGLHVSRLALGMMSFGDTSRRAWVLDQQAAEPIVRRAIEQGITFFDTADMYAGGASELVTGRLLHKLISRDEAVVATKVFYSTTRGPNGAGLSRKHILDYVDLYQIHRSDPATPIEETMEALHDVVRSGKARYLGASTMPAWQFAKAQAVAERHGWTRFVSMQNHYNLVYREEEREMIPLCRDQGVAVLPYSPLARGLLAKPRESAAFTARATSDPLQTSLYSQPGDEEVIDCVRQLAEAHATSPAHIALSWLIHRPGVTAPVIGATSASHIDAAVAARDLILDDADLSQLQNVYRPHIPDLDVAAAGAETSPASAQV